MALNPTIVNGEVDGSGLIEDVNRALVSIQTCFRGSIDPAATSIPVDVEPGTLWWNTGTTDSGLPELWVRNAANNAWLALITQSGGAAYGNAADSVAQSVLADVIEGLFPITATPELDDFPTIAGASAPTDDRHLVTKDYVDSFAYHAPIRFNVLGEASVQNNVAHALIHQACKISSANLFCVVAPTGSNLTVNIVRITGTSSPIETSRTVTLTAGSYYVAPTLTDLTLAAGDRVRLDITGVGSTVAGGNNLLVTVPLLSI